MDDNLSQELNQLDVGVIIINYNNSELTIDSIQSVLEKTSKSLTYEIVVVDNASKASDYQNLVKLVYNLGDEKITIVRSVINTGFGGGNMMGVQHINATYYAFINNDTLLQNDCLSILKKHLDTNEEIAIGGPEILNARLERQVSFDHFTSVQREIFGSEFLEFKNPKKYPKRKTEYKSPLKVNYVNGSFMFCRSADFNSIGGFDTNIFLFFEENDLSYRLLKQNKTTCFIPEAKYIHFQGKSMPSSILTKIELKTSMFYVIQKHYGYFNYQLLRLIFIIRYGLTSIIKPKYWPLFYRILIGLPISKSLKNDQRIVKF